MVVTLVVWLFGWSWLCWLFADAEVVGKLLVRRGVAGCSPTRRLLVVAIGCSYQTLE